MTTATVTLQHDEEEIVVEKALYDKVKTLDHKETVTLWTTLGLAIAGAVSAFLWPSANGTVIVLIFCIVTAAIGSSKATLIRLEIRQLEKANPGGEVKAILDVLHARFDKKLASTHHVKTVRLP